jgi:hypothetical protein
MTNQDVITRSVQLRRKPVEHRIEARRSVHLRGLIKSGPQGQDRPCTIHDLSSQGAGLSVISTFGLPQSFRLIVEGEHNDRYCRVMWVDGNRIGVLFE